MGFDTYIHLMADQETQTAGTTSDYRYVLFVAVVVVVVVVTPDPNCKRNDTAAIDPGTTKPNQT